MAKSSLFGGSRGPRRAEARRAAGLQCCNSFPHLTINLPLSSSSTRLDGNNNAQSHMVFTPLLASATTGTLEARSVAVAITSIQKALFEPQNQYMPGT